MTATAMKTADRLYVALSYLLHTVVPTIEHVCHPDEHGRGRCVLASLVAMDVLQACGFDDAAVLPCTVVAANAGALEYERLAPSLALDKQQLLAERLMAEKNAHSVMIGAMEDPDPAGGWSGHLVVVVKGRLLDLTLEQASRPAKGILLQAMWVALHVPEPTIVADGTLVAGAQHDQSLTSVRWYATPSNTRYQTAPDAATDRRQLFASPLAKTLSRILSR